jgi:hypothetical protein
MALHVSNRCPSPCFVVIKPVANSKDLCDEWSSDAYWFEGACTMPCEYVTGFSEVRSNGTCTVNGQPLPLYYPNAPAAATYALPMPCTDTRCAFALTIFVVENDFACRYAFARDVVTVMIMAPVGLGVALVAYNAGLKRNGDPQGVGLFLFGETAVFFVSMLWDFIVALAIGAIIIASVVYLLVPVLGSMIPDAGREKHAADPAKVALPKPS